jgi:hypothetical protein
VTDDRRWLDDPRNVTRIVHGLAVLCGLALIADFFYAKHPHFAVEALPGFYAVYGFAVSMALVLSAKELRRLVRRDEDYYDPDGGDPDGGDPDGTGTGGGATGERGRDAD